MKTQHRPPNQPLHQGQHHLRRRRYDTEALQHYWGFKWLDATGLSSFWIALIHFFAVLGLLSLMETILHITQSPELKWTVAFIGTGFPIIWLVLARGAQKDYSNIVDYAGSGLRQFRGAIVQHSRAMRILETTLGALLGETVSTYGRAITASESLPTALGAPFTEFKNGLFAGTYSTLITLEFILAGICLVHLITFLSRQTRMFSAAARSIRLDLLNPEPLAVFANQALRTFLGLVGFAAMIPLLLNATDEIAGTLVPIGVPLFCVMLSLVIVVSIPLWIIRNRLRQAKRRELQLIERARNGDRAALAESHISGHQDAFQLPQLLYYEDRIRAVWEWPLHAHNRRIALYVFLVPIAWVLAAIVEMFVDTALQ